ncbi:MAG: ABC transporter ATP-binding protein [Clostridiales bacterium]|nr:ABC transporter ATP-binding protein [Clostridiales bacterium]
MVRLLKVERLSKSFGGLAAVRDLSFRAGEGRIVSIIGPNGAGKTTVFNLLTGIYAPDQGKIELDGRDITGLKPTEMVGVGICRTFQNIRLFKQMTVMQNVLVGYQSKIRYGLLDAVFSTPRKRREDARAIECADRALEECGLLEYRDARADALPYGKQRKLEIARAIVSRPRLLFLDEPAAGLNIQETTELSQFVVQLSRTGIDIVLIEHDMRMVMKISDYIYVLNHGELIAEGKPAEVQRNEEVIQAYIGRKGGVHHALEGRGR